MPRALRVLLACCTAVPLVAGAAQAVPGADDGAALELFESNVRPVLVERCYECHSAKAEKVKGGLLLDSRAGWQAGGDSGPVIVPGDPDGSLLVQAVRYAGETKMPPKGRLSDDEVAAIAAWVAAGAPDPRDGGPAAAAPRKGIDWDKAREHWSFQPIARPAVPPLGEGDVSPIDAFVRARLEAAGMEPAPEADRRTLIRRVTFDLIGLPPTPEEVADFLADDSADAWAKVVDRLLASPHYGEKWGRRWLDLVRYADSNGLDENLALANAWRYRDWVVRAFDRDEPYDRFVTEQLAGDLLPAPADEQALFDQWTATGFLVLGPKMLAEQDKDKLVMDVIDEQIDVLGKTFLGMTLGCARCHDHKFDPIPTKDYYALAGILKSTSTMANLNHVSRWRERELATDAELAQRKAWQDEEQGAKNALAAAHAEADAALMPAWRARLADYLVAASRARDGAILLEAEDYARGDLHPDTSQWGHPDVKIVHTSVAGTQFVEYDVTVPEARTYRLEARYAAEDARPMRLLVNGELVREGVLGSTTGSWMPDTQTWEVEGELALRAGANVIRLERQVDTPHIDRLVLVPLPAPGAEAPWPDPATWADLPGGEGALRAEVVRRWAFWLARAEREDDPLLGAWSAFARLPREGFADAAAGLAAERLAADASGEHPLHRDARLALAGPPPADLPALARRWQLAIDADAASWRATRADLVKRHPEEDPKPDAETAAVLHVLEGEWGPFAVTRAVAERLWPPEALAAIHTREQALAAVEARKPEPFPSVLCVQDGEPVDVPVCIRGSHLNLSEETVPRGFLRVLSDLVPDVPIAPGASGRLALARWITHPRNPLTARVMANRIWQGHFGQGLVRTPSNFGLRGDPPTHPELLDWLARRFVDEGWSIKSLHRDILLSRTYRMADRSDASCEEADPEDLLLWTFPRRRLGAEELRDAILAVSGRLDLTMGGSLLATPDAQYVTNDQSKDQAGYAVPRRSLYLPLIRNAMYDFFAAFDYNDPSVSVAQRPETTVANQTLQLLNGPLARTSAAALAEELFRDQPADESARMDELFLRAYGRRPSDQERQRSTAFLAEARGLVAPPAEVVAGGTAPATSQGGREEEVGAAPAADATTLRAWQGLCQALLASNEFLYVD